MPDLEQEPGYEPATTHGEWRLPPGLKRGPSFYARRKRVGLAEPAALFEHLHRLFGKIARYRFLGTTMIFVSDPEWINEILVNQGSSFVRERTTRRLKVLLGESIATSDDPIHKQQRRIMAPAFHRQHIAGHAGQIIASAAAFADRWSEGQEIDIASEMMQLGLRIIAKIVFDSEVNADLLSMRDEVNTITKLYILLIAFPRLESLLRWPIPGLVKFRKSRERLDAQLAKMIASCRALTREQLEQRGDVLAMLVATRYEETEPPATRKPKTRTFSPGTPLLQQASETKPTARAASTMTDTQIRDEVLTIYFAGYETVANALIWTWYLLSQNPEAAAKMYAEVAEVLGGAAATVENFPRLKYTEKCFAEAMRLYPPVWVIGRQSTKPVELGPYRFPPGTSFFFSQYVMHRSPEFWDDPLVFRPERHTPEAQATRPRFVYFPFGGGRRQCIGEGLAWMQGVLVLATIAQRWRLNFVPKFPVVAQARFTLRPEFPMIMRVERTQHPRHNSG